ncbi:hypothetical protein ACFQHN_18235 [Natrialbaceae archaeon GCM10025896]
MNPNASRTPFEGYFRTGSSAPTVTLRRDGSSDDPSGRFLERTTIESAAKPTVAGSPSLEVAA